MAPTQGSDLLRKALDQIAAVGLDAGGAAVFGPAWPFVKPLVEVVRSWPSASQVALDRAWDDWQQELQRSAERIKLAQALRESFDDVHLQLLRQMAETRGSLDMEDRARRLKLEAQFLAAASLGVGLGQLFSGTTDVGHCRGLIRSRLFVLGAPSQMVGDVFRVLEEALEGGSPQADAVFKLIRDFISCSAHPLGLIPYHLGIAASDQESAAWHEAISTLWHKLGLPTGVLEQALRSASSTDDVERFAVALSQIA